MKQINKIHLIIKCIFSIFLPFIFLVIITNNTNGQEQREDNLGDWLNKNKNPMQIKMFETVIKDRIAGGINIEYGQSNYYKDLFQFNESVTTYGLGVNIFMTNGIRHYNRSIIIDELSYFETLLGYRKSTTFKDGRDMLGEATNEGSAIIPIGFGVGKSYNNTKLSQNLYNENSVNLSVLNSNDNAFLELGTIYGYEVNLSYNDYSVSENNRPNDGLARGSNSFLFTDYFKSFVCYRLSGHTALEFGVKRNLIYRNSDYLLTSLGSKAVETGYFYLLDYLVTQTLLKSGDENTYIYNFVMQNAASLLFYSLKKDNYSFPLPGGKTYSAFNIYFGLRF